MKTFKYSLLAAAIAATGLHTGTASAVDNIHWTGFLNAVANFSDTKTTYLETVTEDGYFGTTGIGLNATAKIDDHLSIAAQLVGGGHAGDGVAFDWGFANYRVSDTTTLKFGKIKYAGNLYSETIDVGFTYPWIHAPEAIYSEPAGVTFEAYKGAAAHFALGANKNVGVEIFYGASHEGHPEEGIPAHSKMTGLVVSAENDTGKLQASYTTSTMELLDPILSEPTELHGETYAVMSVGGMANFNNIGAIFEYAKSDKDGTTQDTITNTGAYLTLSYTMGSYMPHLTVQSFESDDGSDNVVENNVVALGLNKQLSPSSILKFDIKKVDPKEGSGSAVFFENVDTTLPNLNDESVTMFDVALNYVF